ncbi:MAG: PulJ/GspJ family protein [Bacteriovoracaceae bacterium]
MKSITRLLKTERGFSLMEMLIATAISSIIVGGALFVVGDNTKLLNFVSGKQKQLSEEMLGRTIVFKDLRLSSPSFFFLNAKGKFYELENDLEKIYAAAEETKGDSLTDEEKEQIKGRSERLDYCVPVPSAMTELDFWFLTGKNYCQGVEIELSDEGNHFEFLIYDKSSEKDSDILDPAKFYDVGPNDFKKARLSTEIENAGLKGNGLYKFQSASSLYKDGKLKNYGVIYNLNSDTLYNTGIYETMTDHCQAMPSISNINEFFQCLPGHGLPRVKTSPVRLVRYQLEKRTDSKGKENFTLIRLTSKDGTNWGRMGLIDNVLSVRFYRKRSSEAVVSFAVTLKTVENRMRN